MTRQGLSQTLPMKLSLLVVLTLGVRGAAGCAASSVDDQSAPSSDLDGGRTETIPGIDSSSDASVEASIEDGSAPTSDECSSDGWCVVPLELRGVAVYSVWGSGPNDVWAVGSWGTVLHYDGSKWSTSRVLTDAGQPKTLISVWGSGPNDVWIASVDDVRHCDGWKEDGPDWSAAQILTKVDTLPSQLLGLWGTGAKDVWVLHGANLISGSLVTKILHSEGWVDGSPSLKPAFDHLTSGSTSNIRGIWGSSPSDVWVVGDRGRIFRSSGFWGGMASWKQVNSNTHSHLRAVWGSAPDDIWAVGDLGTIRHYTHNEGGELVWSYVSSPTGSKLGSVWGSSGSDVWAVGEGGTIVHGDGTTWTTSSVPKAATNIPLYGVWGSGPNDVWIVGERLILHRGPAGVTK